MTLTRNYFLTNDINGGAFRDFRWYPDLDDSYIFHIFDVFPESFLDELFSQKGKPGSIISDGVLYHHHLTNSEDINYYGIPLWLAREVTQWNQSDFNDDIPASKGCFNVMMNRKQLSRFICLKLIEMFLDIKKSRYTWSGSGREFDCQLIVDEMNHLGDNSPIAVNQKAELLSPVKIKEHFIKDPKLEKVYASHDGQGRINYGTNRASWDILKNVFTDTVVSLIVETVPENEKMCVFTEKTFFSVFGLNFPIWIGGYKQAEFWKKMGFDVFDDVIDHSYQDYDTLIERCVYAIKFNLDILTNINLAAELRIKYHDRLLENRNRLFGNCFENYTNSIIDLADTRDIDGLNQAVEVYKGNKHCQRH
jgi:hypothetical protein